MKIVFKRQPEYPQIEREFTQLDKRLYPIIDVMEACAWYAWKDILVVTRIKEPKKDDSTHYLQEPPYRHIDFALLESGEANSEKLRNFINAVFPYSIPEIKGFSTIPPLLHKNSTALPFHVQVAVKK